jgi:hypothetical protein
MVRVSLLCVYFLVYAYRQIFPIKVKVRVRVRVRVGVKVRVRGKWIDFSYQG